MIKKRKKNMFVVVQKLPMLDCPFCGHEIILDHGCLGDPMFRCKKCGALVCFTNDNNDIETAIQKWNRRVDNG